MEPVERIFQNAIPPASLSIMSRIAFLASYLTCGLLHELCHLIVARALFEHSSPLPFIGAGAGTLHDWIIFVGRALIGRYCIVGVDDGDEGAIAVIRHSGWLFSLLLAVVVHGTCVTYWRGEAHGKSDAGLRPAVILAAYVTALEAITTDLLGFAPELGREVPHGSVVMFCGNFGVLLINSSWVNVDGGKRALDILEKMIEVTMMRGAQSGGVVTYEPVSPSAMNGQTPQIRAVRSRVVNGKRTVLSKGVRHRIEKDNCNRYGKKNLRGWNEPSFSPNSAGRRLVRGFFGHTRFATTSKATMDGTHPHQFSPRKVYSIYPFQSSDASSSPDKSAVTPKSQLIGVENYVTHNGDFEFYKISGRYYDTGSIQKFLVKTLHVPLPSTVDSAAVAGMMDLLRVQGSFALSARYAISFKMENAKGVDILETDTILLFKPEHYETIGKLFEKQLDKLVEDSDTKTLEAISSSPALRSRLVFNVTESLRSLSVGNSNDFHLSRALSILAEFVSFDVEDTDLSLFVNSTIDAFFDNDLLHSMRIFVENAKGSFGICVTSSLDAHRQVVFAAKGQTMSIAFYPRRGIVCYGSEQAAVKAGLNYDTPCGSSKFKTDYSCADEDAVRLDLDDLGGEICLLDWGYGEDTAPAISPPNQDLAVNKLMGNSVNVILLHLEDIVSDHSRLHHRLVRLEDNEFIKPLLDDCDDPVLKDILDIPSVCANIQDDWLNVGLNRMTAWHLGKCVQKRLQDHVDGSIQNHAGHIDILVTGCEVSLWAAEQFTSDLTKCFPKLGIKAVSSNKLLGLFGQELSVPAIGFPYTKKSMDMKDPIIIIVSHSGGTFSPLACSNLMQSFSSNIFVVTSEWDTQIGKQLRSMNDKNTDILPSRIFSTEVGVRPAEPCSVSVVATHQLLTNIFEHICITIISNPHFRHESGAIITERDLQTLERCNRDNINALKSIVNRDMDGPELELRAAGDLWAEHILENAKAYIMSFIYIVVTVTIGMPLVSGIAYSAGLRNDEPILYFTRFLDALIYFWLPQINILILRIVQGRNLRHRMVGRTVVIGDPCPWVAQSAEAFLSKIFACSYSIAGLNVLSGNPADHLVHRHTHRVVRGSLLVCGRPDGRLTALTTLEASTCLAVNQASSIQSMGGTCESITIGHNMSKLPLTKKGIFLETHRPRFLCEKVLEDVDEGCLDETSHPMNLSNQQSQRSLTRSLSAPRPMNLTDGGHLRSSQPSPTKPITTSGTTELQKLRKLDDDSTTSGNIFEESANSRSVHSSILEENEKHATDDDFFHQDIDVDMNYAPSSITVDAPSLPVKPIRRTASMGSMTSKPIRRSNSIASMESMTSEPIRRISSKESMTSKPVRRTNSIASMESMRRIPSIESMTGLQSVSSTGGRLKKFKARRRASDASIDSSSERETRSSAGLIGAYANLDKEAKDKARRKGLRSEHKLDSVIDDMIEERKGDDKLKDLFHRLDLNRDGFLDKNEFILAYKRLNPDVCAIQLEAMFEEGDVDDSGTLDLNEFMAMVKLPQVDVLGKLSVVNRDSRGLVQVNPSNERFFGEDLQSQAPRGVGAFLLSESQHLAMEMYESRVASMQRYVAMCVMFHQMGMRVQSFFPKISFGLWGYRMDRTHSIMRIATTASPVSGADVRERMVELHLKFKIQKAVNLVGRRYREWKYVKEH